MRQILLRSLFCLLFFTPVAHSDWNSKNLAKQKQQAIDKLKARRAGFEEFLERKKLWDERRLSRAGDQKKIRKKYAEKREEARRNFVREEDKFPYKAYRKFLQERKERRKNIENARRDFSKMSKELNKIYENEKYKIDENKEYEL